eukprot:g6512.t1
MGAGPWNRLAASDVLCKISTLDFDLAIEMAVMSAGLLAATQLRKRHRLRKHQQHDRGSGIDPRPSSSSSSPPGLLGRCCDGCSITLGWVKGVAWTSAYAYGGLLIVRLGRWLLLLLLLASSDQQPTPFSVASTPGSPELLETTIPPSGRSMVEDAPLNGDEFSGEGGKGWCRGMMMTASDEGGLTVALAVAVAAAAFCYTLTAAPVVQRLLGYRLVRVPLGLAAEALRAGCIAASAETALDLISSTTTFTPQQQGATSTFAEGSGTTTTTAVLSLFLGLLRVLACMLAGAAVSCVGGDGSSGSGGSSGGERGRGRFNPSSAASRSVMASPAPGSALQGGSHGVVAVAASPTPSRGLPAAAAALEAAGKVGRGERAAVRGDAARAQAPLQQPPAAPAWFVPSGALGGAFYALTAGGVFEIVMREYVLGDAWFASPSSVRTTVALVFAVVFALRAVPGGEQFNPLVPCYRLLGFGDRAARAKQSLLPLPPSSSSPPPSFPSATAPFSSSPPQHQVSGNSYSSSPDYPPAATTGGAATAAAASNSPPDYCGNSGEGGEDDFGGVPVGPGGRGSAGSAGGGGDSLLPSRVSALRGETRAGAGAVDVRAIVSCGEEEGRLSTGVAGDERGQRGGGGGEAGGETPPALAISWTDGGVEAAPRPQGPPPRLEVCCESKVGRAAGSLGQEERALSPATAATAAASASSVGAVSVSRPLFSKDEGSGVGWWKARAGEKGGGQEAEGDDGRPPRPVRRLSAESHPSWRLPSPAAAAAASSSGVSGRGGSGSESFPGGVPSARSDATAGGRGGGRTTDIARLGDGVGPNAAAAAAATTTPGSSNDGAGHLAGPTNEEVGGVAMPPSATTTRPRRASMPPPAASAPAAGGRKEDRRRSVGSVPAPTPARPSRLRSSGSSGRGSRRHERAGGRAKVDVNADVRTDLEEERPCGRGDNGWLRLLEAWLLLALLLTFVVRQVVFASSRDFWLAKALAAWALDERRALFDAAERALLLQFPFGVEAGVSAAALAAAARVRRRFVAEQETPAGPLPGLVLGPLLAGLGAFGGNLLACLALGTRSMVLTEEIVWPASVAAWVLVGGRLWGSSATGSAFSLGDFLSLPMVHHCLVFLAEAFRASLVCGAVDAARAAASAIAVAAPPAPDNGTGWTLALLAGVLAGCGGRFLPGDRGLSPLSFGVPWAVQSSLYAAACYWYCRCTGVAAGHGQAFVALFLVSVALVQTTLGPAFNPLCPLHRAAYLLTGVAKTPPPREVNPEEREAERTPTSSTRRRSGGSGAGSAAAGTGVGVVGAADSVQRHRRRSSSSIDARRGRLLALSTTTIAGQPLSPEHRAPQQPPTALADTEPTGTIVSGSIAVADAATACLTAPGAVGAGCSSETGPGVVDGDVEASGRRPSIIAGAEDLVGLNPQQLIEQVLVAREAAAHAAERADAAERAARHGFPGGQSGAHQAVGGENDAGSDRWSFFESYGGSRSGGSKQAPQGGVGKEAPSTDGALHELLSRKLLASAVEGFSSAVGDFSKVSRVWLEEVAGGHVGRDASEHTVLRLQARDPGSPLQSSSYPDSVAAGEQLPRESAPQQTSSGGDVLSEEAELSSPFTSSLAGRLSPVSSRQSPPGSNSPVGHEGDLASAAATANPPKTAAAVASMLFPGGWLHQRREHDDDGTLVLAALSLASPAEDAALPDPDRTKRVAAGVGSDGAVIPDGLSGGAARTGRSADSSGRSAAVPPSHAAALDRTTTTTTSARFLENVMVGDAERMESDVCPLEAFDLGSKGAGASSTGGGAGATLAEELFPLGSSAVREEASDPRQLREVLDGGDSGGDDGSVESGGMEEETAAVAGNSASVGESNAVLGSSDATGGKCDKRSVWASWAPGGENDELVASPAFGESVDAARAVQTGSDGTSGASADGGDIDDALVVSTTDGNEFPAVPGGPAESTIGEPPTASPVTGTDDAIAAGPVSTAAGAAAVAPGASFSASNKPAAGVLDQVKATPVPVGALLGAVWSAPPSWVRPKAAGRGVGLGFHRASVGVGRSVGSKQSAPRAGAEQSVPEFFWATMADDDEASSGDTPCGAESHPDADNPVVSGAVERSSALASEAVDSGCGSLDGGDAAEGETHGEESLAPAPQATLLLRAKAAGPDPDGRDGDGDVGGGGGDSQGEETIAAVAERLGVEHGVEHGGSAVSPAPFLTRAYSEQAENEVSVAEGAVLMPSDGSGCVSGEARQRPIPAGGWSGQADASASAKPDAPPSAKSAGSVPADDDAVEAPLRKETISLSSNDHLEASIPPPPPPPPLPLPPPRLDGEVDAAVTVTTAAGGGQQTMRGVGPPAAGMRATIPASDAEGGTGAGVGGIEAGDGIGITDAGLGDAGDAGAASEDDALPAGGGDDQGMFQDNSSVDESWNGVEDGSGGGGSGGGGGDEGDEAPGAGAEGVAAAVAADTLAVGAEVRGEAALALVGKEKKQDAQCGDEKGREGPAPGEEGGVVSDGEEAEEEKEAGSKGWWARAGDRRRAKAEEKALHRASKRAAAARKHESEQLQDSKRLAILEAEETEKQLRLLDEVQLRATATAIATGAVGRVSEVKHENASRQAAAVVETLQADEKTSSEGQAAWVGGANSQSPQQQQADGESGHRVDPKDMDMEPADHPARDSVDPSSVGDGLDSIAGYERRGVEEEEEARRPKLLPQEQEQQQQQQAEPARGASSEKKRRSGKRARGVVGVILSAAYYAVWAAFALVLG